MNMWFDNINNANLPCEHEFSPYRNQIVKYYTGQSFTIKKKIWLICSKCREKQIAYEEINNE